MSKVQEQINFNCNFSIGAPAREELQLHCAHTIGYKVLVGTIQLSKRPFGLLSKQALDGTDDGDYLLLDYLSSSVIGLTMV